MSITDDLKKLDDDTLSSHIVGLSRETQHSLLAKWEWERRKLEQQHEYDRKLLAEQVKWMKYSALMAVVSALIGAVVGAILLAVLTWWFSGLPR
jgi:hypothetical protein